MTRNVAYYQKNRPLKIFLSYYGPHKHLFFLDMFCALVICLIDLAFPYLSRSALNHLLPQQEYRVFFLLIGFFAVAYVGKGLLYFVVSYWGHVFGVRVEADLRRDLYSHMESLSFSFFDKNRTGVLMSRVTNDLFEITELAHHGPEDLFISTVTLVGAFGIMCTIEWKLAVLSFAIVPFFLLFTIYQRRKMRRANLKLKAQTAEINAAIESGISGMRTAKAFQNEETEKEKFKVMNRRFVQAKSTYYKTMATFQGGMEFSLSIMPVLVIGAGGYFIMRDAVNYADLVAFTLYVTTFTTPVKKLVNFVEQFMAGLGWIQPVPGADAAGTGDSGCSGRPGFGLGPRRGPLRSCFFSVQQSGAGATGYLTDHSSRGKICLCWTIRRRENHPMSTDSRFYDVTEGAVLIDGHDVRKITQHSLRQNIGIVQQEVFLFADSVLENIRYGRPDATDEEVVWAARQAEIHEDILAMPNGYETYVGERGVMLSGGQKQRISIARVFLKNPPIVILDEATSALDSVTEAKIQASFDRLCEGRTSIIIAHRLSTIRNADRIAVVDREEIIEQGSHPSLMAQNGEYAALVRAQEQIAFSKNHAMDM